MSQISRSAKISTCVLLLLLLLLLVLLNVTTASYSAAAVACYVQQLRQSPVSRAQNCALLEQLH
jgi:hypothetical protein